MRNRNILIRILIYGYYVGLFAGTLAIVRYSPIHDRPIYIIIWMTTWTAATLAIWLKYMPAVHNNNGK